jgi:hypothetical protein
VCFYSVPMSIFDFHFSFLNSIADIIDIAVICDRQANVGTMNGITLKVCFISFP